MAKAAKTPADMDVLSFEEAMQELETIVQKMETGQTDLNDAVTSYERAMQLKTHCEAKLKDAQNKIEKITVGKDGNISGEPLDSDTGET